MTLHVPSKETLYIRYMCIIRVRLEGCLISIALVVSVLGPLEAMKGRLGSRAKGLQNLLGVHSARMQYNPHLKKISGGKICYKGSGAKK